MAWGTYDPEASSRRVFLEEARRRVLALLEDLHWFTDRYGRRPPGWTFERLAALAQLIGDDVTAATLADSIAAVEDEVRNALAELGAVMAVDLPIPYAVTHPPTTPNEPIPAPAGLRPFLVVLRGGRA